ncbi:MAG TPA: NAD(P)H-dependent oxidoreductase [Opitutaceae bacterium]
MHALIVVSHPDPKSLTHSVAAQIADEVARSGHTVETADLAAEGFDPRFNLADVAGYRRKPAPADVVAEQARIDRADALVLVYPVYWWSMPAQLKGWIDRVFSRGWAYDDGPNMGLVKKLHDLRVHLVGLGGADAPTYERHGYLSAMKTQIDHGIFDYCGARVVTSQLLLESEIREPSAHFEAARELGRTLFARPESGKASHAA